MEKGTVIIGIDPDNQESGVGAVFDDKKFLAYKNEFSFIDRLPQGYERELQED